MDGDDEDDHFDVEITESKEEALVLRVTARNDDGKLKLGDRQFPHHNACRI